jgi:hypothetical protein
VTGDVACGPRGVPHSCLTRSPRSVLTATSTPAGIEQHFIDNGTPVVPGPPLTA